jgi:hypothetical protein
MRQDCAAQPGLAYAGLTGHQHDAPVANGDCRERRQDARQLTVAPDERRFGRRNGEAVS